jgi:hypothetical protein
VLIDVGRGVSEAIAFLDEAVRIHKGWFDDT